MTILDRKIVVYLPSKDKDGNGLVRFAHDQEYIDWLLQQPEVNGCTLDEGQKTGYWKDSTGKLHTENVRTLTVFLPGRYMPQYESSGGLRRSLAQKVIELYNQAAAAIEDRGTLYVLEAGK